MRDFRGGSSSPESIGRSGVECAARFAMVVLPPEGLECSSRFRRPKRDIDGHAYDPEPSHEPGGAASCPLVQYLRRAPRDEPRSSADPFAGSRRVAARFENV